MKVIAVGNMKGGVGKTTIAVNLACEIAVRGKRTLLIDLDEQGTSSDWNSRGTLPIQCSSVLIDNIHDSHSFINGIQRENVDRVVLDLPPHTRESTEAAIWVSDILAIPVTPSGADFISTRKVVSMYRTIRQHRSGKPLALLIPSKVDRRTGFGKEIHQALQGFGEQVAPAIGQRTAFIDSFGLGDWIGSCAPKSTAYLEIQSLADAIEELLR